MEINRDNQQLRSDLNDKNDEMDRVKALSENKEQWESHLGTIIQWVHDEKDARSYLENLATRMSEELESIRVAKQQQIPLQNFMQGNNLNTPDRSNNKESNKENWQTLRQKKVKNAQILDLQSALQGELQKRMEIEHDFMQTRRKVEELEQDLVQARLKIQEMEQSTYHQVIHNNFLALSQ